MHLLCAEVAAMALVRMLPVLRQVESSRTRVAWGGVGRTVAGRSVDRILVLKAHPSWGRERWPGMVMLVRVVRDVRM